MQNAKSDLELSTYHSLDYCQRLNVFLFILQVCPILTVKYFFRLRFYGNNDFVTNLNISKNISAKILYIFEKTRNIFKPYIHYPKGIAVLRQFI